MPLGKISVTQVKVHAIPLVLVQDMRYCEPSTSLLMVITGQIEPIGLTQNILKCIPSPDSE